MPAVLTEERQSRILDALARDGRVISAELVERLGVSLDTVRRDLSELEATGAVRRVRGGALPPATRVPAAYADREGLQSEAKAAIAARAAELVRGLETVLLGGGTTMLELARHWPSGGRTTALTPSLDVAGALLGVAGVDVYFIGGRVLADTRTAVGAEAVATIAEVRADACILGTCSLDAGHGMTLLEREEAHVARAMVEAGRQTIVLADAGKLGTVGPFVVAPPERLSTLVTDSSAPAEVVLALREHGAEVVRA